VVISSTIQVLGYFRPFVAVLLVQTDNGLVFFCGPLVFLDVGVQVVVPPFTTLLSNSAWQCFCNITPILCPIFINIFREFLILFQPPWALYHRWIEHLLPPMQTLDISPQMEVGCNLFPVFCAKLLDKFS